MSFSVVACFTCVLAGPPSATGPARILPLERVRLYETGVGYFERRGAMQGGPTRLPLPKGHLDDALKTLVILGGKAEISGVQFATAVSEGAARALAGLQEDGEGSGELGYAEVMESLEGAEVAVRVRPDRGRPETVHGRLLEVQGPFDPRPAPIAGQAPLSPAPPEYLLIVLDALGGVRRLETSTIESIAPLDTALSARLDLAGATLSQRSAQAPHPLAVSVAGPGEVGLGYVAETPVWRTTYRVVLDADSTATLQAWALIHNDTDENWRDVDIELVNGRPTSFLFPLAAPRYAWRTLAEPADDLSTVAQLSTETADEMFSGASAGGLVGYGVGGGSYGAGGLGVIGHGTGGGVARQVGTSLVVGDLAGFAQSQASESGAQFVYALPNGVDLDAHHSALVPVFQSSIEAESITWFDPSSAEGLAAVRLVNTTAQTLPVGTVAFFADGGFAGEAALDRLKPADQRFVMHGAQLDVELQRTVAHTGFTIERVHMDGDESHLVIERIEHKTITLDVRNRTGRAQRVFVGLDLPRNARVEGAPGLDFDRERAVPLAVVPVAASEGARHALRASTGARAERAKSTLTAEYLRELAQEAIADVDATRLRHAADTMDAITGARRERDAVAAELVRRVEELSRLRTTVQSVKDTSAGRKLADRVVEVEEAIRTGERTKLALDQKVPALGERRDALLGMLGKDDEGGTNKLPRGKRG